MKIIEVKRMDGNRMPAEMHTLSQSVVIAKLNEFRNNSRTIDKFPMLREGKSGIEYGILKPEKIPALKLSLADRSVYIDIQNNATVLGWLNNSTGFSDVLYHKTRGVIGDVMLYTDATPKGEGNYPFKLDKACIEKGYPVAELSYKIPMPEGVNPNELSNAGLMIRKTIKLENNGNTLRIGLIFENGNPAGKETKLGFRIKNYPRIGGAIAGSESLSKFSKIIYNTPSGRKNISAGAPVENLFLRKEFKDNKILGIPVSGEWIYSKIVIDAGDGNRNEQMILIPDKDNTAGFYSWWSVTDFTVELLSAEKTLKYGQSYSYEYIIELK